MNGEQFINYINDNYFDIKNKFLTAISLNTINEDIFHDTIIKCYDLLNENKIDINNGQNARAYLFASYRMNLYRNKLYANNKPKLNLLDVDLEYNNNTDYICDIHMLNDKLLSEFDDKTIEMFFNFMLGDTIPNLQRKYNVKNLKYQFKKIRNYINTLKWDNN